MNDNAQNYFHPFFDLFYFQNLILCSEEGLSTEEHYSIRDGHTIPCFVASTGEPVNVNVLEQVHVTIDNSTINIGCVKIL